MVADAGSELGPLQRAKQQEWADSSAG